jgi:hypothetical protein
LFSTQMKIDDMLVERTDERKAAAFRTGGCA